MMAVNVGTENWFKFNKEMLPDLRHVANLDCLFPTWYISMKL